MTARSARSILHAKDLVPTAAHRFALRLRLYGMAMRLICRQPAVVVDRGLLCDRAHRGGADKGGLYLEQAREEDELVRCSRRRAA